MASGHSRLAQTLVGCGLLVVGGVLAVGAVDLPAAIGYSGVGPNFLPWLVAGVLVVCAVWVIREANTGGYRNMEEPTGSARGYWPGFAWVSAGLLANAALITTIGFILSCTLCFALAVRGLRHAEQRAEPNAAAESGTGKRTAAQTLRDVCIGLAIAAPVYWMFTKLLAINLPGLTSTGWL